MKAVRPPGPRTYRRLLSEQVVVRDEGAEEEDVVQDRAERVLYSCYQSSDRLFPRQVGPRL